MLYYKFVIIIYISSNIEGNIVKLLDWLKDLMRTKQIKIFIHNTTTENSYHRKYMICKKEPIIIDYIYSKNNKDTIYYINTHFDYNYICIMNNPKWINISLLYTKFKEMYNSNQIYYGDIDNTIYSNKLIKDFLETESLDINTYMSFNRYIDIKEIPDKNWNLFNNNKTNIIEYTNINLSTLSSNFNIPFYKNIFITDQNINICSQVNEYDIRLDYSIYYDLLKTGLKSTYRFYYLVYIYPGIHLNFNTLYNIIDYIDINNINYYNIDNIFYIASYNYIFKNAVLFNIKNNLITKNNNLIENYQLTLFDFYNNINIYDYHDNQFIYNTYNVNESSKLQDIIALRNPNIDITKPYHKYIFVIYSSKNTLFRINTLREYWLKLEYFKNCKLIIVIGNHIRTHMEREHKFGLDIDILYTEDDDSYIKFPYKVYNSIKYISNYYQFEYFIKIDDDVYLNINKLYKFLEKNNNYDFIGYELGQQGIDKKWHYGRATKDYEFEWNEEHKGTYFNGPCYVLSNKAAILLSNTKHENYMKNHIYEDVAVSNILYNYDIKRYSSNIFNIPNIYEYFKYTIDENKNITWIESYNYIKNYISFHCGPFSGNGQLFYNIELKMIFDIIYKNIN